MTSGATPQGASLRLFVAIELPETWKQALERVQQAMQQEMSADASLSKVKVRWVRPEGIHLTLKFIGNVPAERVSSIEFAIASAVPAEPGIELSLDRTGAFSDKRAPRVIIATVGVGGGYQRLQRLAESIETWLAPAGVPRERRTFTPHLTLARLPVNIAAATRQTLADVTNRVQSPQAPALQVTSVSLMRSHLGPGGARYERLAAFPTLT